MYIYIAWVWGRSDISMAEMIPYLNQPCFRLQPAYDIHFTFLRFPHHPQDSFNLCRKLTEPLICLELIKLTYNFLAQEQFRTGKYTLKWNTVLRPILYVRECIYSLGDSIPELKLLSITKSCVCSLVPCAFSSPHVLFYTEPL